MVEADALRLRLDVLLDALSDLRRYRDSVPLERLESDRDTQHMVLHAVYVATQAVIDIAFHASADAEQALSPTYRAVFDRLAAVGLLEPSLAQRLAGWAGLRNVLAHQYASVDFERVHCILHDDLGDLESFAKAVGGWLDHEG